MKKQAARIVSVTTEPGMAVTVGLSDGRTVRFALNGLAERLSIFAPLENPDEFATAKAADFGWTLEWDCGASLDVDRVVELALEQDGMAANVAFRRWQDAHRLSLAQAAAAIGLSRRTVSQYRTGVRPVPRTVALACKGWEAEQGVPGNLAGHR
jgi:DNA-binding XRE family transcriptional regulator